MSTDNESYLTAAVVIEMFDSVEDVKVSRYTMEVSVKQDMGHHPKLVDYLENKGWNYTGHYSPRPAANDLDVYTFEL